MSRLLPFFRGHVPDLVIPEDGPQDVEQLSLVLVDALDLDVQHGLGLQLHPRHLLHLGHRPRLGLQLALPPCLPEFCALGMLPQALQPTHGWHTLNAVVSQRQ